MKMILLTILTMLSITYDNKLVGRWESVSPSGNVTGVVFKEDNTFEGYINQKPFVTGTYNISDNIFEMLDNGCMGVTGSYKINFFSNNDSFRFELIDDKCEPRARIHNRVFGKKK